MPGDADAPEWYRKLAPAAVLSAAPPYAGPRPAPVSAAPGGGASGGPGVEGYIRQAAAQRGIDPDTAVRVAQSEGGLVPTRTGSFATGKSFWPFQLHYGGAGTPYEKYGTVAGMGNTFTQKTGWQPGDPEAWQAATDYALDAAKRQGWGAWYGARTQGITGFQGITRGAPSPAPSPAGGADAAGSAPAWYQKLAAGGGAPAGGTPVPGAIITRAGQPAQSFGGGAHAGVDISAKAGTPVRTPVGGEVVANLAAGQNPLGLSKGYGRAVAVRDAQGDVHVFGHGGPDFGYLPVGTRVHAGDTVSVVGSPKTKLPGEATEGEHLHWEIRGGGDYGKQVDPEGWLKQRRVPATNDPREALSASPQGDGGDGGAPPAWYQKLMGK